MKIEVSIPWRAPEADGQQARRVRTIREFVAAATVFLLKPVLFEPDPDEPASLAGPASLVTKAAVGVLASLYGKRLLTRLEA